MKSIRELCGVVLAAATMFGLHGQAEARVAEQTNFSAEDAGVRHPVVIPAEVMELLAGDAMVKHAAEYEHVPLNRLPSSWFSASTIHLGSGKKADLIVAAEGPLAGANVEVFWVFVRTSDGYRLALMNPAHDLEIRKRRSHDYRDIRTLGATASAVTTVNFKFDGAVYREASARTETIR